MCFCCFAMFCNFNNNLNDRSDEGYDPANDIYMDDIIKELEEKKD
jgi:hypothetical protein